MPTYEYKCTKCQHRFEREQRMSDAPVKTCPKCAGPVIKVFSASGIIFKGSGFHNTDYGKHSIKKTDAKTPKTKPAKN